MTRVSDVAPFAEAVADEGGLPFLALALLRRPEVAAPARRDGRDGSTGRPWGVGHPRVRPARAARASRSRRSAEVAAAVRPDRRGPARPGRRAGARGDRHLPARPLAGPARSVPARRGPAVRARGARVRRARRAAVELRPLGAGRGASSTTPSTAGIAGRASSACSSPAASTTPGRPRRSPRWPAPLAARGVQGRRPGRHRLPLHPRGRRHRRDRRRVPGRGPPLRRDGAARDRARAPGPRQPDAVRRPVRRGAAAAARRGHDRPRRSAMTLEGLNVGRLRVAAKGVDRGRRRGLAAGRRSTTPTRRAHGLYMLGQAATLRDRVTTIAELHREIADGRHRLARPGCAAVGASATDTGRPSPSRRRDRRHVGGRPRRGRRRGVLGEHAPRASTRSPRSRPTAGTGGSTTTPTRRRPTRSCRSGAGSCPTSPFDPLRYGMPPSSLPSIEPLHLLTLEAVRAALDDAGYRDRPFPRERTAVVLGHGRRRGAARDGLRLPLVPAAARHGDPRRRAARRSKRCRGLLARVDRGLVPRLPPQRRRRAGSPTGSTWAGRTTRWTRPAARRWRRPRWRSASWRPGAADMVVLGGADTVQNPFTYLAFSKTQAFSPRGRCRPFDAGADGIVISEGVAAVVLKRLADAERDGDRIYAVIKGLGASSDGRAKGLTAPRLEGQVRALERAYAKAGRLAGDGRLRRGARHRHGASGDLVEVEALTEVFRDAGAGAGTCVVGSVKSLIGHTKCAAGLAGLINASLALHHRVLPPTIGVETPNPKLDLRGRPVPPQHARPAPWLHADVGRPRRRAGVSAFGFGGTNFHAVLEAYEGDPRGRPPAVAATGRPSCSSGGRPTAPACSRRSIDSRERLAAGARPALRDLAHTLWPDRARRRRARGPTLAIVASSLDDLLAKLRRPADADRGRRGRARGPARGRTIAERPALRPVEGGVPVPGPGVAVRSACCGELAVALPRGPRRVRGVRRALLGRRRREPLGPLSSRRRPSTTTTRRQQAGPRGDRGRPAGDRRGERRAARDCSGPGPRCPTWSPGTATASWSRSTRRACWTLDDLAELSEARGGCSATRPATSPARWPRC